MQEVQITSENVRFSFFGVDGGKQLKKTCHIRKECVLAITKCGCNGKVKKFMRIFSNVTVVWYSLSSDTEILMKYVNHWVLTPTTKDLTDAVDD